MNKLVEALAAKQLGEQFNFLSAQQKSLTVNETLNQLRASALEYGISFKNSDSVLDVIYNYLSEKISSLPEGLKFLVPAGFVFLIFITVKGAALLLRWVISVPAYILYELALTTGFARLTLEAKSREIVVLK